MEESWISRNFFWVIVIFLAVFWFGWIIAFWVSPSFKEKECSNLAVQKEIAEKELFIPIFYEGSCYICKTEFCDLSFCQIEKCVKYVKE